MKPASVAGPLNGRDEPVPKKLLLPALSTPTVLREVIGFTGNSRRVFLMAPIVRQGRKPRSVFRRTKNSVTNNVIGISIYNATCSRLI